MCLIIAKNSITYMQKDFSNQYNSQTVEARDFTLEIINIPKRFKIYKDEFSVKF